MILNTNQISVDIKATDKLRSYFSRLKFNDLELKCVMLGDSDIDYELSQNINNARILNAPYSPEAIKYPLIYNGLGNGVKGTITSFVRYVDANGDVSSFYNYPTTNNLSIGIVPPTLANGNDIDFINFTNDRMGVIVFLQTLLDYYKDENGIQQRLKENYEIKILFNAIENVPSNWQIIKDEENKSLLIAKTASVLQDSTSTYNGEIKIKGLITQVEKSIKFNI